jgi:hypothetical protein
LFNRYDQFLNGPTYTWCGSAVDIASVHTVSMFDSCYYFHYFLTGRLCVA